MLKMRCGIAAAVIIAVGLTGCASKSGRHASSGGKSGGSATVYAGADKNDGAYTQGIGDNSNFAGNNEGARRESLLSKRTFRFGFDQFNLDPSDYEALSAHASYLKTDPGRKIRIEGHTDEQGSREYNIGLGERRAKAITNVFLSKGVSPHQFNVVSYGEEKPESFGSNEDSYRLNRRAVIVYEEL